jgi:Family of unknown function (DUF6090)
MMQNTKNISWFMISANAMAIVISILIAFSIDAWWADRQERKEEQLLLSALHDELQTNIVKIEHALTFRRAMLEAATQLLEVAAQDTALSSDEFDQLLGVMIWWGTTEPVTAAYASLSAGGKLSLIEDTSLRSSIASLSSAYEGLHQTEWQHYETLKQVLMPYLYEHATIAQLSNALPESPGTGGNQQPRIPVANPQDHRPLMQEQKFLGIITHIYWDQNDAIYALNTLMKSLDDISAAIALAQSSGTQ